MTFLLIYFACVHVCGVHTLGLWGFTCYGHTCTWVWRPEVDIRWPPILLCPFSLRQSLSLIQGVWVACLLGDTQSLPSKHCGYRQAATPVLPFTSLLGTWSPHICTGSILSTEPFSNLSSNLLILDKFFFKAPRDKRKWRGDVFLGIFRFITRQGMNLSCLVRGPKQLGRVP